MAKEKFSKETILEIIKRLIGPIQPVGDTAIDNQRFENVELFVSVFNEMHVMIDDIAYKYKDDECASTKRIVDVCKKQLDGMGIIS